MVKTYCDICGLEVTDNNNGHCLKSAKGARTRSGHAINVEVGVSIDGERNGGHVCKYCVIDCVGAADDRPRLAAG